VVGQVVACGWWLGDGSGYFHWGVVGKGAGGYSGQVEGGARVVVVVAGRWVHSLERQKEKNLLFFSCFCIGCGGWRPHPLIPQQHWTDLGCIGTGPRNATALSAITWTTIYGRLGTRRLDTAFLCILL
jgi:hypothetical protein